MCASRVGQLLNMNAMALDCGLSHNTAKAWLSVLETSGIVHLLGPYHKNFGKRLVKSPKLYFVDTGLAVRLDPNLHFWRDSLGTEVDVVFEDGRSIKALEIKSGKTIFPDIRQGSRPG